jgi:hypothetical protein
MADFLPSLWESVFTSGPTPTLLLATNVTFAALQLVLALLLFATYSIHFAILSTICGGLWWSINWFASEVAAVRAEEEEAKAKAEKEEREKEDEHVKGEREAGQDGDDEGESTEVEQAEDGDAGTATSSSYGGLESSRGDLSLSGFEEGAVANTGRDGEREGAAAEVRQRNVKAQQHGDLSGEVSTDSEWEKVEDGK